MDEQPRVKEIFCSLDLEFCQPSDKICQIGAVVGNIYTGEVLDRLRIYVDPGEPISEFITNLCGITQDHIDHQGIPLDAAYEELRAFHTRYRAFINPLTWGGGDSEMLRRQLKEVRDEESWCFGRRWIDVKTIHISLQLAKGKPVQGGLAKTLTKYGLRFEGRKHDATDDALNTFKLYCELLKRLKNV